MPYDPSFQAKVFPVLMTAFEIYLADVYDGRLYASVAPATPTFPLAVYQSQDGGGLNADFVDQSGWEGLVTFRSLATTLQEAWDNLALLSARLPGLTASGVAGYSIKNKPEHPQWFPVEKTTEYGSVYTAGLIVSFSVYKE